MFMAKTHINVRIDSGLASFMLDYKLKKGISTKSEVVERALKTLRDVELKEAYKQAMEEWVDSGEHKLWDKVVGDGLDEA